MWLSAITKAVAAVKRSRFLFVFSTKTFIAIEFISSRPSCSRNWNGILLCSSPCSWLADKHTLGSWLHCFRFCAGIHYQRVINLHFFCSSLSLQWDFNLFFRLISAHKSFFAMLNCSNGLKCPSDAIFFVFSVRVNFVDFRQTEAVKIANRQEISMLFNPKPDFFLFPHGILRFMKQFCALPITWTVDIHSASLNLHLFSQNS